MTNKQIEKVKEWYDKGLVKFHDDGHHHEGYWEVEFIKEKDGKTIAWIDGCETIILEEDFKNFTFFKKVKRA